MKHLISTEIASAAKIVGDEKAVELCAKAGFDAWDLSMTHMIGYDYSRDVITNRTHPLQSDNYVEYIKNLRKIGEDNGIHCNQSHAPFPSYAKCVRDYLKRAIEATAIAGGKICIIHPCNNENAEKNAEMYLELLPFAKQHGVKIATENMFNWNHDKGYAMPAACSHHDDFLAHVKAVNDNDLVACLDIGHSQMFGLNTSAREMILTLGDHLQALHIHDNDLLHDSHAIPFSMKIDFNIVIKSLKEIGYKGYFTLEANRHLSSFDADNVHLGLEQMAQSARRLTDMLEACE